MSDVFISYKRGEASQIVQELSDQLEAIGYNVWYDQYIHEGVQWRKSILNAIVQCDVFMVLFTRGALNSTWITIECNVAFSLDKKILPVLIDVFPNEIPEYMRQTQAIQKRENVAETYNAVVSAVKVLHPTPKGFWWDLFEKGLDIYVPLEEFEVGDGHYHGVNLFSFQASQFLLESLHRRFNPHFLHEDPVRVVAIDPQGDGRDEQRQWLIIGGPGGVPYVHTLLKTWLEWNESTSKLNAYRSVGRPQIANGPIVRGTTDPKEYGIEDVQNGIVTEKYNVVESTGFVAGVNFGVIYTAGFSKTSVSGKKIIILSAFTRRVLPGMINFILNDKSRNDWLNDVAEMGEYTETLMRFRDVSGSVSLLHLLKPRNFGKII